MDLRWKCHSLAVVLLSWMTLFHVSLVFVHSQGGEFIASDACVCNPEDAETGRVCANNGQTYDSACDFRLKQGLRADIGIRCVGPCPCDDTLLALGIECSAAPTPAPPAPGLEFCATNAATYTNENLFMCDQIPDQTLAIACPGPCPCQLADCPSPALRLTTLRPLSRNNSIAPPRTFTIPIANSSQQYAASPLNVLPAMSTSPNAPAGWNPFSPVTPQPYSGGNNEQRPLQMPQPEQRPPSMPIPTPIRNAYAGGENTAPMYNAPPTANQQRDLHRSPSTSMMSMGSNYNPLVEALRTVPFRLFRHLYILVTVSAEGMKQIPIQIAKNMQARLPPYVKEIPMEMAKSVQEALNIHFNSLSQQVKETVEQVRGLLEEGGVGVGEG